MQCTIPPFKYALLTKKRTENPIFCDNCNKNIEFTEKYFVHNDSFMDDSRYCFTCYEELPHEV